MSVFCVPPSDYCLSRGKAWPSRCSPGLKRSPSWPGNYGRWWFPELRFLYFSLPHARSESVKSWSCTTAAPVPGSPTPRELVVADASVRKCRIGLWSSWGNWFGQWSPDSPSSATAQPDPGAKPGFQSVIPRLRIQAVRLWGPNAWGSKPLSVVSMMPGPSQRQKTSASGPNSLRT